MAVFNFFVIIPMREKELARRERKKRESQETGEA
jgi:hypothetical protein